MGYWRYERHRFLEEALVGIDAVIHGAAIISFDKRYVNKMYETNVLGTADLVNTCLKLGIKDFIHISSVAAIGRKAGQKKITEKDRWEDSKYDSIYANSKHAQELEVWRGAQEGLKVKILNPSVVLGPGIWGQGVVPQYLSMLIRKEASIQKETPTL